MSILGKRPKEEGFFSTAAKVLMTSTLGLFSNFITNTNAEVRDNHDVETQPEPELQPQAQARPMPRPSKKKILNDRMANLRKKKALKRNNIEIMAIRAEIKANLEAELEVIAARKALRDEENRKRKEDESRNCDFGRNLTYAHSFRLGNSNKPELVERSLFAEKKAKECEELARYYRHDGQSDLAKLYEKEADKLINIAQSSTCDKTIINFLDKNTN
jgi:hypothetical protein